VRTIDTMRRVLLGSIVIAVAIVAALVFALSDRSIPAIESDSVTHEALRTSALELGDVEVAPSAVDIAKPPQSVREVAVEASPAPSELERKLTRFVDAPGDCTIEARIVHDEDGRPFAGANVQLMLTNEEGFGEPLTTGADGIARFEHVRAGAWLVRADAPGCALARGGGHVSRAQPEASLELRLSTLREVSVRLVAASGRDLTRGSETVDVALASEIAIVVGATCARPGERFDASDAPPSRARSTRSKSAPYTWQLELRGRDAVCVHALIGDVVLAASVVDPWSDEVRLRVDDSAWRSALTPVVVRVVTGAADVPVVGARVSCASALGSFVETHADERGVARILDFAAGEFVLTVDAPDYAAVRRSLRRPLDADILVRLGTGRRVEGVLLAQDDAPMPRRKLALYAAEEAGSSRAARVLHVVETGLDGRFVFADLDPGQYAVSTHSGTGYARLPRTSDWPTSLVHADCRERDAHGLVVRGFAVSNDTRGPEWNPTAPPR